MESIKKRVQIKKDRRLQTMCHIWNSDRVREASKKPKKENPMRFRRKIRRDVFSAHLPTSYIHTAVNN